MKQQMHIRQGSGQGQRKVPSGNNSSKANQNLAISGNGAQSAFAYQQQPNNLNRSYEANQIQSKLHNSQLGGTIGSTKGYAEARQGASSVLNSSGNMNFNERRKINMNYSTQLPNNQQVQAQNQILSSGNYGHNTHQIILNQPNGSGQGQRGARLNQSKGNSGSGQRQPLSLNNNQNQGFAQPQGRGYSNDDPSMASKFKKKNGRIQDNHLGQFQNTGPKPLNNSQLGNSGSNQISQQYQMNNTSNHNRKLTPSKQNNIRSSNNNSVNLGRSYDKTSKQNGRSNTIELQAEKDSRKNIKRKERAGSSIEQETSGLLGGTSGAVQVADGSILIGPGGRPKTSSGKHTTLQNGGNTHTQMAQNTQNSRLSHYSAGQNTGVATKTNQNYMSLNGPQLNAQLRGQKLSSSGQNQVYHQRAGSTQENYPSNNISQNNNQMRRSLDGYQYNNQRQFNQVIGNFQNQPQNFGQSQILGAPGGSLNKLPKYSQNQTPQQISNNNKIRRKRDFSQVIDPNQKQEGSALNSPQKQQTSQIYQQFLEGNNQEDFNTQNQKQFNTIQAIVPGSSQNKNGQSIQSESSDKVGKFKPKTHLRSLTSHKGPEDMTSLSQQNQRNGGRRQPSASGKQKNQTQKQDTIEQNDTIAVQDSKFVPNSKQQKSLHVRGAHSEDRNSSNQKVDVPKKGSTPHNVRASISKEVTTSSALQTVQPRQASKKFDNCVTKFAFATKTGYSPKNPNKVNQDSFLVLPHLGEYRRTHFFAVADGHGVNGKPVSEFVKSVLAKEVESSIKYTFDQAKINQRVVDSTEVKEQLDKSFHKVTDGLYKNSGINLRFSGSTCVSVLIVGNKVFCANVGDSRATLARRKEIAGPNGQTQYKMVGIPLNRDHKADEPDEQQRIIQSGGRVAAYRDMQGNPLGPARVWHLHEDIPGLAMSRSFGDQAAAEVGVNANPEITEMNLIEADKFLILASDGVWEFISNDQAVNIVMPHYQNNSAEKAAEALIREAMKRWQEEDTSIDDITCIIIFLNIQ